MTGRKEKLRRIYLALMFGIMLTIFWFSAQPADESSNLSGRFMAWLLSGQVPLLTWLVTVTRVFEWLNIRKCAHAFIYFMLGISAELADGIRERAGRQRIGRTWLFCVLYACFDEMHQFFVPGRSCELRDVLIDSVGALIGALLVFLTRRLREKREKIL